jgi:glycosyltransferase involved in cell wall biosynthesis
LVPAYNEQGGIRDTLVELSAVLGALGRPFEVIVVNDGSRDDTAAQAASVPGVRVISHPVNIGYGNALKTGILNARHEWIGIIDADGTYPCQDLPRLLEQMDKGFNMVVGERSNIHEHDRPLKNVMRRIYKASIRFLAGNDIRDPNSGFRIFEKRIALEFFDFLCGTFSFTTGLTILAFEKPYFVCYVPIQYQERVGKSHVRHVRDSIRTIQLIIQGVTYYNPLKFFVLLALAMVGLVGFPAMCLAMLNFFTLSGYYMIFGCTVSLLLGLGLVGDIVRVTGGKIQRSINPVQGLDAPPEERP